MANVIRNQRLIDSSKRCLTKVVIVSDGSEEANTVIIDVSTLANSLNANGYIMTANSDPKSTYRTTIKRVFGSASTAGNIVKLQWHGASNSEIVTFGQGSFDFNMDYVSDSAVISNPESSPSGDILVSTAGLHADDLVTIFIDLKKDARDFDAGQTRDPAAFNR